MQTPATVFADTLGPYHVTTFPTHGMHGVPPSTVVRVQFNEYSGEGKYGPYQGLDLQAVQIVDLVPYKNGDGDEFFADGEEF